MLHVEAKKDSLATRFPDSPAPAPRDAPFPTVWNTDSVTPDNVDPPAQYERREGELESRVWLNEKGLKVILPAPALAAWMLRVCSTSQLQSSIWWEEACK